MYELEVRIDSSGPLPSDVQYSNGSGNLVITGYEGVTEYIHFVRHPNQKDFWKFLDFPTPIVLSGPPDIGGQPVIELVSLEDGLIVVKDLLGEYGRYKYTIKIKAGETVYISDPELQNRREIGPNG